MLSLGEETSTPRLGSDWWRVAVVYQVYIRSFADSDGDGIGDINGLLSRLGHLASLGVDAIWVNPWFVSPQADAGYDVADYRDIEPDYGTLADAEALVAAAHAAGIRVVLDIVPNHTSSEHAWFKAALAGDESARARYVFRPGRGPEGAEPPNDWVSIFGGPAWTRVPGPDGSPGEWYLHLFAPEQPDLDWENPEIRDEFDSILRFWFDRGVDGFRIDVAHGLAKDPALPDAGLREPGMAAVTDHPAWDQDSVHEIYARWRKVADSYDPPRIFVAEAWVADNERLAQYLRPGGLHTAFQFDLLQAPFVAERMRATIVDAMAAATGVGAPPTWVLSNHDVVRHVTRYARSQPNHLVETPWEQGRWGDEKPDLELGARRARAAALVTLGLPGTAYLYQGEELGLPEVEDIPDSRRQDPIWEQSGRTALGRDGARVPLPWAGNEPPYGFSPPGSGADTWLPQPENWSSYTAEAQESDPASMLNLYRAALACRHGLPESDFAWIDSPDGTLAFRRGAVECWLNTGSDTVPLPEGEVLLHSVHGSPATLPPDSAAWVKVP